MRRWLYLRSQVSPWDRLPSESPWPPAGRNSRASHSKVKVDLFREIHTLWRGFPGGAVVKNLPANAEGVGDAGSIPGSGRFPWSRKWQPTLYVLPGESCGQRSLAGYSPQVLKKSDSTAVACYRQSEKVRRGSRAWASLRKSEPS